MTPHTLTKRQIIDIYLERVLQAQHDASDWIQHKPTKGELREKFVKWLLMDEFPFLEKKIGRGVIIQDDWESSQVDFIWLSDNARSGNMAAYDLRDCKMIMEIKSRAAKNDLDAANNMSQQIKSKCSESSKLKTGIFCYATHASKYTVLKKFGFSFDKELGSFGSYNAQHDEYKNLNFLFCLDLNTDEPSPYFVVRDGYGNNNLFLGSPVVTYYLNLFKD